MILIPADPVNAMTYPPPMQPLCGCSNDHRHQVQTIRSVLCQIFRADETSTEEAWMGGLCTSFSLVCLRRQTPLWFENAAKSHRVIHWPMPGIGETGCVQTCVAVSEMLPAVAPLAFFCHQGLHRTGLVAAATVYRVTGDWNLSAKQLPTSLASQDRRVARALVDLRCTLLGAP